MRKIKTAIIFYLLFVSCLLLYSQNSSTSADPGILIAIDRNFSDWEQIPSIARFSSYFNPYYFNREIGGKIDVHKIEDSLYWKHNGTQLKDIRAVVRNNSICFYFSSQSPIAEGFVIYLYLFKDRTKGEANAYTIEVRIDLKKNSGILYLWEKGKKGAIEAGKAALNQKEIECELSLELLPRPLSDDILSLYSFDLTTCFYEKASGTYEEFFFTTAYFRDIPYLNAIK